MAKTQKGLLTNPTEDWVAEMYSPPYLFIDGDRRASVRSLEPASPVSYRTHADVGGKTVYLIHSGDTFRLSLENLPEHCSGPASLVLIKLPSATHGWENGQHFVPLPFHNATSDGTQIEFRVPDAKKENIPPAYYMLFYIDCDGKPAVARMVRFDNEAGEPVGGRTGTIQRCLW